MESGTRPCEQQSTIERTVAVDPQRGGCSGVLLSNDWVLTVRHGAPSSGFIYPATADGALDRERKAAIVDRFCLPGSLPNHDLALLRVRFDTPENFAWVGPEEAYCDRFRFCGFGREHQRRCFLTQKIADSARRLSAIKNIWGSASPACADGLIVTNSRNHTAIRGDSGGPLFGLHRSKWCLLGVLSAGDRTGTEIFTSYAAHYGWVANIVRSYA